MNIRNILYPKLLVESFSLKRPAIITTNRGTEIKADHVRLIKSPRTGIEMYVVGIGTGNEKKHERVVSSTKTKICFNMRDFFAKPIKQHRDPESAYNGDDGAYWESGTHLIGRCLFDKLLTINAKNVTNIQWI